MAKCKTVVTQLLTHWSDCSITPSHWYVLGIMISTMCIFVILKFNKYSSWYIRIWQKAHFITPHALWRWQNILMFETESQTYIYEYELWNHITTGELNRNYTMRKVFLFETFMLKRLIIIHSTTLSWWRHQMETFSALLAICAGYSLVTVELPAPRPMTWSYDIFFDLLLE